MSLISSLTLLSRALRLSTTPGVYGEMSHRQRCIKQRLEKGEGAHLFQLLLRRGLAGGRSRFARHLYGIVDESHWTEERKRDERDCR